MAPPVLLTLIVTTPGDKRVMIHELVSVGRFSAKPFNCAIFMAGTPFMVTPVTYVRGQVFFEQPTTRMGFGKARMLWVKEMLVTR